MIISRKKLTMFFIGIFSIFFLFVCNDQSSALSGAPTNTFPDNSIGTNGGSTEAVVQLSTGGVWLKAQTTTASIYVPRNMVDPTGSALINLTILGACDTGQASDLGRDFNGGLANTYYSIENNPENNSDFWCGLTPYASRGNLTMSFTATPKISERDVDDGYYVYKFRARAADGTEASRYLNAFKVRADTANVRVGVANWVGRCQIAIFPNSCPPPRAYTDIYGATATDSFVYSSFYGTSNPGGVQIDISSRCKTRGQISFYDLDINTVSQPNMQMEILRDGIVIQTLPNVGIVNWETGIFGFFDPHPGFSGRDNGYLDIPGGDPRHASLGTFEANSNYIVRITGIDRTNAIQINASITTCQTNDPIGFADSCILQGSDTIIFGWAYDDNGTNINQPRVRLNVTGQAQQNIQTDQDYRSTEINTYLDNARYSRALGARNNRYGFRAVYSGLARGNTYSLNGTIVNEGLGADQALGLNGAAGPPGGGVAGSLGFPGGNIPSGCLPIGSPTGTIVVTCDATGSNITVSVNASNPTGGNVNVALVVNRRGGTTNVTGTGSGTIPLSQSFFPTNFGGADSTRTVSGTVTSVSTGTVVNMAPVVYNCPAVPECRVETKSVGVGEQFYITVTLRNNTAVSTSVSGPANFTVYRNGVAVPGPNGSGAGRVYDDDTELYSDWLPVNPVIQPGGTLLVRSNAPLSVATAGSYDVRWDVVVAPGVNAVGDCGSIAGGQGAIDASVKPYVRFYGNDIVAGGGFGNCTNSTPADVRGFSNGASTHANYKGSAVELAVFAAGEINGVLPGAQNTLDRTALTELSFANEPPLSGEFGGGFGDVICADDYWAERTGSLVPTVPAGDPVNPSAVMVDLSALPSGEYTYSGDLYLYSGVAPAITPIPAGRRITIYNEGNTVIGRRGGPVVDRLAYDTSAPWASVGQIPLVKVVTRGNMFIDDNVVQVDGLYVAIPVPGNEGSTGEIHTCAAFGLGLDLTRPLQQTHIATGCTQKLEINGAFIAKRVHLLRTNGNIQSGVAGEPYTSANIAEVFRFSPEMYLALLSNSGGSGRFDSILSLPPAL